MKSQADRETRLAQADDVLVNDRDVETLIEQVRVLHQGYLESSSAS
jgi:dephospho-CoA kinase